MGEPTLQGLIFIAMRIFVSGQKPEKLACSMFTPTKALKRNQPGLR